jgi:hypothetical protein
MNCAVHTDTPAASFCRTCGKALCENCKRDVQGAIYCEPCIAARLQGVQPPPAAVVSTAPSPGIALMLGFIPGVGAMYNGQFIKGFVHVMIFVMLIIGSNHHWSFGVMIPFFIFYMAFDAYKTAEARMLGLPAPDPLGIDKMFGLQESQPPAASAATTVPAPGAAVVAPPSPAARSNEPIGAIVLIGLGVLFLLGNLGWLHAERLLVPLVLIGLGVWIAYKRTVLKT